MPSPPAQCPGRPRGRWTGGRAALVCATGVVVGLVGWRLDLATTTQVIAPHAWALIAMAVLAQGLTVPCKAFAWAQLSGAASEPAGRVGTGDLLPAVLIGALLNAALLGRVGEPARLLLAQRRLARRGTAAGLAELTGSALTETLASSVAWVAVVVIMGAFLPLPGLVWAVAVGVGAGWLLVVVAAHRGWWSAEPDEAPSAGVRVRVGAVCRRVWTAVERGHVALARPTIFAAVLAASAAGWLLQWVGIYAVLIALDLDYVGWSGAALVLVSISVAQAFPLLPGNVGVFQAAAGLPLVASYGAPPAEALLFGVLFQLAQVAPIAVGGAIALVREGETIAGLCASARRLRIRSRADGPGGYEPAS